MAFLPRVLFDRRCHDTSYSSKGEYEIQGVNIVIINIIIALLPYSSVMRTLKRFMFIVQTNGNSSSRTDHSSMLTI